MKAQLIITLVILSIILAILSHGIIAAAFSLFAFTLLFYFVSSKASKNQQQD